MARIITVGAAQLGPIARSESRISVVNRLIDLMKQAKSMGCQLVVYPELALTTFFPRWYMEDQAEIDQFFEMAMPNPVVQPLFDLSAQLEIGFYLGYAEKVEEHGQIHRYNTSILVNQRGEIVGKYRKIHLPGHAEHEPWRAFQHLEKRYFEVGDLGFGVWRAFNGIFGMCICNDRRWPETYRVMGLQGVEMVLLGYNTPQHVPAAPEQDHLNHFHNLLSMQAGAYQNGTWVVGVAKCGREEGCDLIGDSCIVAPSGELIAKCRTVEDELIVAQCDLDAGASYKNTIFNFAAHRQPQHYQRICEQAGTVLL
ncbi:MULTISPECIES: N-carbamoyl-D-amino-acid hydrolase [unclassified Leptolyngbya]|uniref:N-carbamoyl-D-amino-acid hydrolase n=1 Tax=unclassified Leptolyngbya TaxID=2650499 RepID=UPI001686C5E1|nr:MULTISPECIES: N-carbamoyl-D-amino-acid hydrolase [unclassified Leptolyngbya]MBD1911908.1 N-carbamoyl-D-amino-acid hydrolase [Leptolyngbya sp. FACHB-8]MBD2156117.1 N-carbamoyl-D-amino-acid hydrolase [Leptolyngbya sp. FACHB-16]